jgi:ribosomal 50S subunit-recycling heat shock protein
MRLDLFLKASRLCPRRTVAQKICEAGRASVNGNPAKSSHSVKSGDEILLQTRDKLLNIRVISVPGDRQTSRKDAKGLYEILSEKQVEEDELRCALIGSRERSNS